MLNMQNNSIINSESENVMMTEQNNNDIIANGNTIGGMNKMYKFMVISKMYDTCVKYHYNLEEVFNTYDEAMQFIFVKINSYLASSNIKYELEYSPNIIAIKNKIRAFREEIIQEWIIIDIPTCEAIDTLHKRNFVLSAKENKYHMLTIDDQENDIRQDISDYFDLEYKMNFTNNCHNNGLSLICDKITIQQSNNYHIINDESQQLIEELVILAFNK